MRGLTPSEEGLIETQLKQLDDRVCLSSVVIKLIEKKGRKKKEGEFVIVIGRFRIYVFKTGCKAFKFAHLLDLEEIRSSQPDELTLVFKPNVFQRAVGIFSDSAVIDSIIRQTCLCFVESFPSLASAGPLISSPTSLAPGTRSLKFSIHLYPTDRYSSFDNVLLPKESPCGSFGKTYKALCAYYRIRPRSELSWEVASIWDPHQVKHFHLNEIQFATPIDFRATVGALKYNNWFTSLCCKHVPLPKDAVSVIADMIRYNNSIEEISLQNVGCTKGAFQTLGDSFASNRQLHLNSLDLSGNPLGDGGLEAAARWCREAASGVKSLNFSKCGSGNKGTTQLCIALAKNERHHDTLEFLSLSGNRLDSESSLNLGMALKSLKKMRTLELSSCGNPKMDVILAPLRTLSNLFRLDLSGNKLSFTSKSHVYHDILSFFRESASLEEINLSACQTPIDTLCDFILNFQNVRRLELKDCEFKDQDLKTLCNKIREKPVIQEIFLDRGWRSKASKFRPNAIRSLIDMINNPVSNITLLSLAGSKKNALQAYILPFLVSLGYNATILELDISGHSFADTGAIVLSKALQQKIALRILRFDDNGVTDKGFRAISTALTRNSSLHHMSVPLNDLATFLREPGSSDAPSKDGGGVQVFVDKMQRRLAQNSRGSSISGTMGDPWDIPGNENLREDISRILNRLSSLQDEALSSASSLGERIGKFLGTDFLQTLFNASSKAASIGACKEIINKLEELEKSEETTLLDEENELEQLEAEMDEGSTKKKPSKKKKKKKKKKALSSNNRPSPRIKYTDTRSRAMNKRLKQFLTDRGDFSDPEQEQPEGPKKVSAFDRSQLKPLATRPEEVEPEEPKKVSAFDRSQLKSLSSMIPKQSSSNEDLPQLQPESQKDTEPIEDASKDLGKESGDGESSSDEYAYVPPPPMEAPPDGQSLTSLAQFSSDEESD